MLKYIIRFPVQKGKDWISYFEIIVHVTQSTAIYSSYFNCYSIIFYYLDHPFVQKMSSAFSTLCSFYTFGYNVVFLRFVLRHILYPFIPETSISAKFILRSEIMENAME